MEYKLEAKTAHGARKEAARRWPNNDVNLRGLDAQGEAVYLSLVRNVTKGNVATATKGITPVSFTATPVEAPLKLGKGPMREIAMDKTAWGPANEEQAEARIERLKYIGISELIAKLDIWVRENVPDNELLRVAVNRLESQEERIKELEDELDRFTSGELQMP